MGVSRVFKSNCLIQALKHRLKGYPIYRVHLLDEDAWNNHFIWWDAQRGTYWNFTWGDNQQSLPKHFWWLVRFEGFIEDYYYDPARMHLEFVI